MSPLTQARAHPTSKTGLPGMQSSQDTQIFFFPILVTNFLTSFFAQQKVLSFLEQKSPSPKVMADKENSTSDLLNNNHSTIG